MHTLIAAFVTFRPLQQNQSTPFDLCSKILFNTQLLNHNATFGRDAVLFF